VYSSLYDPPTHRSTLIFLVKSLCLEEPGYSDGEDAHWVGQLGEELTHPLHQVQQPGVSVLQPDPTHPPFNIHFLGKFELYSLQNATVFFQIV
jgi:hypothetical protein